MRRAAWRATSADSAAAIWCRSRRSDRSRSSTSCSRTRASTTSVARSRGRPRRSVSGAIGSGRLLRASAGRRVRRCETGDPAGGQQVAGDGPQNRYSVPGPLGRAAGRGQDRRAARSASGTTAGRSPATSGCTADIGTSAQLDHYLELLARKPGALARSLALGRSATAATGLTCFDELWTAIQERSGRLGGRPADGRRAAALPRARPPRRSSSPSAARWPPARIDGRAVAVLARRADHRNHAGAELTRLQTIGSAPAPAPTSPATTSCLTGGRTMTPAPKTARWRR